MASIESDTSIPHHINVYMDDMVKIVGSESYHLPEKQKELLKQLRSRLKGILDPIVHDDVFLYRFLCARQFKVAESALMIAKHLLWATKEGIQDILSNKVYSDRQRQFLKV